MGQGMKKIIRVIGKYFEKQNFLRPTQEGVKNMNHPISVKETELII